MYIKELKKWIADQPDHAKLMVRDQSMSGYDQWEEAKGGNVKIEFDTPETLRVLEEKVDWQLRQLRELVEKAHT